jgi:hypothetical protein
MTGDRRLRILTLLAGKGSTELVPKQLCLAAVDVTQVSGAGIMLFSDDVPRGSVDSSDAVSSMLEELQFALGEGPCIEARELDRPVLEPDLRASSAARWIGFTDAALGAGVRAVFGFPARIGAARVGALNLYRDQPGPLSAEQHRDALVVADMAAELILLLQADAPAGLLAKELESGGSFQSVVHQASGMVSGQLDVQVDQALVRLRSYAFGNDRVLADVARDVVDRALRFDPANNPKDDRTDG